jgi:hypothetical protein
LKRGYIQADSKVNGSGGCGEYAQPTWMKWGTQMFVSNKLTPPGGVKRVEITPDIIRVQLTNQTERVYRLTSELPKEVNYATSLQVREL